MKKKTLSLSLMLLVGAACLSGCSGSVTSPLKENGKDVLFSIGAGESKVNVYADDILGFDSNESVYTFLKTDAGKKAVYDAVEKAVVQAEVKVTDEIRESVDSSEMADWDEKIADYVETYGVTSRKAEQTLLEEAGFETRDELYNSYILARQKEKLWEKFESDMTQPYITVGSKNNDSLIEKYVDNTAPMVVKHILVKVADSAVRTQASITESEADKLGTVLQRLSKTSPKETGRNSFATIASEESEDSSASKGGNLGIMDTYTSFVNEFKLGLYVSEAVRNKDVTGYNKSVLGITGDVEEALFGANGVYKNYSIRTVALDTIANDLVEKSDDLAVADQLDSNGKPLKKSEYDAQKYPRNKIFNEYLNFPGVSYLKAKATDTDYLKDENGNPIVMVRSEFGIHFLSITWSSLDHNKLEEGALVKNNVQYLMYGKKGKEITDKDSTKTIYWTDEKYNVGYASKTEGQNARESEIEGRITNYVKGGYGSNSVNEQLYNFQVFKYYLEQSEIEVPNTTIKSAINEYMSLIEEYTKENIAISVENTWESYIQKINSSYEMHDLYYDGING